MNFEVRFYGCGPAHGGLLRGGPEICKSIAVAKLTAQKTAHATDLSSPQTKVSLPDRIR
jgi:hypothetical protein